MSELDSPELTDWRAYHELDPCSIDQHLLLARIGSYLISCWVKDSGVTPKELLGGLWKESEDRVQSEDEIRAYFQALAMRSTGQKVGIGVG